LPAAHAEQKFELGTAEKIGGKDIKSAHAVMEDRGWAVVVSFNKAGAKAFAEITTRGVGRQLAIVAGGKVVFAPVVIDPIKGGSLTLSGNMTEAEARKLSKLILGK